MFVQFVRARQLKAQSVQRSLEEVAVRQIEIEKESVEIGKLLRPNPHLHPSLTPVYPQLNLILPQLDPILFQSNLIFTPTLHHFTLNYPHFTPTLSNFTPIYPHFDPN